VDSQGEGKRHEETKLVGMSRQDGEVNSPQRP